jgi:hypothetical protein
MKKSIFVVLSLLVIAMFLVGCVPQEELSEEDQQALDSELGEMSDQQLDQVIEEAESEGATALAGQAYSKYKSIPKASKSRVLASAYKAKLEKVAGKQAPTFFVGISDESPASDNILATNVIVDLQNAGYNFETGIVKLFSELEGTSLDNQVTLLVYNGDAKIIVGENSPASHNLFATEVAEKLIARGVEMQNEVFLNTEVDTNNLMSLFLEPTPLFIAAVDDNAPASDNLFMTHVLEILIDKGYNLNNVAKLYSEVEGTSLDNQVTLIVLDGKGKVVVGENSPASHNLFATDVALAVKEVQGRNLVLLSTEVDSNDLETAFS